MDENPERRRYYPDTDLPLSAAVREAIEAHEDASLEDDEFQLYNHVNPDAIDMLFEESDGVDVAVTLVLENVTVSIWNDGGVEIRVTETVE